MGDEKYTLIVARNYTEEEFRQRWREEYCRQEIFTFDGIQVHFYDNNFDHAFFESTDRRQGISKDKKKDLLSYQRLSRFNWIKEVLQDSAAELRVGYDSSTKSYTRSRRVAIVNGDYVVIILLYKEKHTRFITAYVADNSIDKILNSPKW